MNHDYTISNERRNEFAGIYLLNTMINQSRTFPVFLEGNDEVLEPILEWLLVKEYVTIRNQELYVPAEKGREALRKFLARYSDFLHIFDVFCAVDLASGEFAFARYFDFATDAEWKVYLNQNRWDDLRIAVAEYKEMDPVEIIFMSFVRENRFGLTAEGWQFDLLLGSVWDEILEICRTAIHWQQLGYQDAQGTVSAEAVIEDIIRQGVDLIISLHQQEGRRALIHPTPPPPPQPKVFRDQPVMQPVLMPSHSIDYYDRYHDPKYLSPVWRERWNI